MPRVQDEPALVTGFVTAVLGVASSFGLGLTSGQSSAIVALVGAGVALVGAFTVRQKVTPTSKLAQHPHD